MHAATSCRLLRCAVVRASVHSPPREAASHAPQAPRQSRQVRLSFLPPSYQPKTTTQTTLSIEVPPNSRNAKQPPAPNITTHRSPNAEQPSNSNINTPNTHPDAKSPAATTSGPRTHLHAPCPPVPPRPNPRCGPSLRHKYYTNTPQQTSAPSTPNSTPPPSKS